MNKSQKVYSRVIRKMQKPLLKKLYHDLSIPIRILGKKLGIKRKLFESNKKYAQRIVDFRKEQTK